MALGTAPQHAALPSATVQGYVRRGSASRPVLLERRFNCSSTIEPITGNLGLSVGSFGIVNSLNGWQVLQAARFTFQHPASINT